MIIEVILCQFMQKMMYLKEERSNEKAPLFVACTECLEN